MKRLLLAVILVFAAAAATLIGLVATEPGTRALFALAEIVHPALSVRQVSGTLVKSLELQELHYRSPDLELSAARMFLAWRLPALRRQRVSIRRLEISGLTVSLPPRQPSPEPVVLPAILSPWPVEIGQLVIHRLRVQPPGEQPFEIGEIASDLHLDRDVLQWGQIRLTMADLELQCQGRIRLQGSYPLHLHLQWRHLSTWQGEGEVQGDLRRLELRHHLSKPFAVTTGGSVSQVLERPFLALQGGWDVIHWPLRGRPEWLARQGRYQIHGSLDRYRITLSSLLSGTRLPATQFRFDARGTLREFKTAHFQAEGAAGVLTGTGTVQWDPQVAWRFDLQGTGLNPGLWQSGWPGNLDLAARTEGRLSPVLQADLDLKRLEGRLRGHPLEARGRLRYRDDRLQSEKLELNWGGNKLRLHGSAGPGQIDLGFTLHAPRLEAVAADLKGSIAGEGRVSGATGKPQLHLSLQGRQLAWTTPAQEILVQQLNLEARIRPDDPGSQAQLALRRLTAGAWRFDSVMIRAEGSFEDHRLRLRADSPLGRILMNARGSYRSRSLAHWQGRISPLPLSLLRPLLPEATSLRGDLEARFVYRRQKGSRSGELDWKLPKATVTSRIEDNRRLTLALESANGHLTLQDQNLRMVFELPLPGHGRVQTQVGAELQTGRLQGRIRMSFTQLQFLEILTPQLHGVSGKLEGEAVLSGTWRQPDVTVAVDLADAEAEIIPAGIHLRQTQLHIAGDAGKLLILHGRLHSGPGQISVDGSLALRPRLQLKLRLYGDRFEAAALPQAKVLISPDLEITGDSKTVRVTGTVLLPQAAIRLQKTLLPGQSPRFTPVSDDEIILGRSPRSRRRPFRIITRVDVALGDEVLFEGYGLDTRLKGKLSLTARDDLTRAEGVLHLEEGKFAAYGQKLDIAFGRLIFSGPVDNPALDIHVVRHVKRENVKVTMRISGFADNPRIDIVSEPPLPEEQAIAYLIAGRSLAGGEGNGAKTAAARAMASLGISYLNKLGLERIARVEFESGSVVVGKYLTADLYIGYGVDIFTGIGEMLLRYDLLPNLYVEGRSGKGQSVDLFYTLEMD